jgi:hypothetical protein
MGWQAQMGENTDNHRRIFDGGDDLKKRFHDDMGGAVFVRTLQLQYDLGGAVTLEPFVGDGRPADIAAELLQFLTLIGTPAHRRTAALVPSI